MTLLVPMSAHQGDGDDDSSKIYDHPDLAKEEQEDFSEHTLEYTVLLSRGPNGLGIKLGTQKGVGNIIILSFPKNKDGSIGPAESTGEMKEGDCIRSIGNMNVSGLTMKEVTALLVGKEEVLLTMVRDLKTSPRRKSHIEVGKQWLAWGADLSKKIGTETNKIIQQQFATESQISNLDDEDRSDKEDHLNDEVRDLKSVVAPEKLFQLSSDGLRQRLRKAVSLIDILEKKLIMKNQDLQAEKDMVSTVEDRMAAMEASFDIAEMSKHDLMIEVETLRGQLCSSPERRKSGTRTNSPRNDGKIDGPTVLEEAGLADSTVQQEQSFLLLAELKRENLVLKEQLKSEVSRKEDILLSKEEIMQEMKALNQEIQEMKFQQSAAGSQQALQMGKVQSVVNQQAHEIANWKIKVEDLKRAQAAAAERSERKLTDLSSERDELRAEVEKEKRAQLALKGDLSDLKEEMRTSRVKMKAIKESESAWKQEVEATKEMNAILVGERNRLKTTIKSLKKDLMKIAHVDALVAEKGVLLLELSQQRALAAERADNIKIFQDACQRLYAAKLLPPEFEFLLDFVNDDEEASGIRDLGCSSTTLRSEDVAYYSDGDGNRFEVYDV